MIAAEHRHSNKQKDTRRLRAASSQARGPPPPGEPRELFGEAAAATPPLCTVESKYNLCEAPFLKEEKKKGGGRRGLGELSFWRQFFFFFFKMPGCGGVQGLERKGAE